MARQLFAVLAWCSSFVLGVAVHTSSAELAVGTRGAVAAEHRLASSAGMEILDRGGNAVDAAVATVLATGVVNPVSSGIGGGGFLIAHLVADGSTRAIDFRETAPAKARRDMYAPGVGKPGASTRGGLAVAVPGELAGLTMALARFGTLSFAEVAAPAIRMARDGFVVEAHLADALARSADVLVEDPALRRELLQPDGQPYVAGQVLRRPNLADTLALVARDGPAAFYAGTVAEDLVRAVKDSGGILSAEDLAGYRPVERDVVVTRYHGWTVLGVAPPSSGGGVVGETLRVLEPYDLADLGNDTVTYIHLIAETYKAAFADRALLYGDPSFYPVPLARLLSSGHATAIRGMLNPARVVPASAYGSSANPNDAGTSHVSVVDPEGNAVACTSSINTGFGSKVGVPGRGIVLNNTMDDFSSEPGRPNAYGLIGSEANSIAPGKRPLSSMSPTIVLQNGRVRLVVGASGGPLIITATIETILNVLDFEMDVETAITAPRFHNQWMPDVLGLESTVPETVVLGLDRIGHRTVVMPHQAAVQAVEVRYEGDQRTVAAASDARKGGVAMAR